jgi:uncharacterized damage-inducible protein DinB
MALPAVNALREQLEGLRAVIASLPPAIYGAAPSRVSGTIGGHVRHTLDHVRTLVSQWHASEMSYDSRLRGTAVETEPWAAVDEIDRLNLSLDGLRADQADREVRLGTLARRGEAAVAARTTAGRELAFVIQHTIHHAAIIAVLLDQLGLGVPAGFGYAPSTPARLAGAADQEPAAADR